MLLCARAPVMTQCTHATPTAQMVVTGKVHNRLKKGSCDSERDAGRNSVQQLEHLTTASDGVIVL